MENQIQRDLEKINEKYNKSLEAVEKAIKLHNKLAICMPENCEDIERVCIAENFGVYNRLLYFAANPRGLRLMRGLISSI